MRPLGGVDRLATLLGRVRAEKPPVLLLAAGDLTFGSVLRPEDEDGARQQEIWRAETLIKIWNQLHLAAATPGSADLGQEASLLAPLIRQSAFPWLVDNVEGEGSQDLPLSTARVIEAGSFKVGIMGLVAPSPERRLSGGRTLGSDLGAIAQKTAASLRESGADLVVALLTGDRRSAKELATKGVDVVVLGGADQEAPLPPMLAGEGVVVHAGYQGQRVVTLDLKLHGKGPWHDASEWSLREARADLEQHIRELKEKLDAWQKDPAVKPAELEIQRARLKQLEAEHASKSSPSFSGRWFAAEVTDLAPEVPKDKTTEQQINAYDRRVNEHNRVSLADRKPVPTSEGKAHYTGSEACAKCHGDAYTWWKKTPHGRAYATLENVNKEYNLSCVGCHVTGYNQPGGSTVTHVENLKDVGCENCHGPGSLHIASPATPGLVARDTPEAICVSCHNHEHSDRFVYESFKRMLVAPGHGAPKPSSP